MANVTEYRDFRHSRDNRRSFATAELPEAKVGAIRASRMDPRRAFLNQMLDQGVLYFRHPDGRQFQRTLAPPIDERFTRHVA
jgi:hypothetical protein